MVTTVVNACEGGPGPRSPQVDLVSVESHAEVTLARGTKVLADTTIAALSRHDYDAIVCPGGMPGAVGRWAGARTCDAG